jgi:Cu+-exporting ATPase
MEECVLCVRGMTCGSCVKSIEGNIVKVPGVRSILVSLERELAHISFDSTLVSPTQLSEAINDMGFDSSLPSSAVLRVEGMTCGSCVRSITGKLQDAPGIVAVDVSLENHQASVQFEHGKISLSQIKNIIEDAGFDVPEQSAPTAGVLAVEGMTCNSCVKSIEGKIGELNGVKSIKVSLAKKQADLAFDSEVVSLEAIRAAVEDMGFDATILPGA